MRGLIFTARVDQDRKTCKPPVKPTLLDITT
jgi:hypothetical protein